MLQLRRWSAAVSSFFFNDTATTEIYTLSLHDALPIVIGAFVDDLCARRAWRRALVTALTGVPLIALVAYDFAATKSGTQRLLWLFSYDYVHNKNGRPWPDKLDFSGGVIAFAVVFSLLLAAIAWPRIRRWAVVGFGG